MPLQPCLCSNQATKRLVLSPTLGIGPARVPRKTNRICPPVTPSATTAHRYACPAMAAAAFQNQIPDVARRRSKCVEPRDRSQPWHDRLHGIVVFCHAEHSHDVQTTRRSAAVLVGLLYARHCMVQHRSSPSCPGFQWIRATSERPADHPIAATSRRRHRVRGPGGCRDLDRYDFCHSARPEILKLLRIISQIVPKRR